MGHPQGNSGMGNQQDFNHMNQQQRNHVQQVRNSRPFPVSSI